MILDHLPDTTGGGGWTVAAPSTCAAGVFTGSVASVPPGRLERYQPADQRGDEQFPGQTHLRTCPEDIIGREDDTPGITLQKQLRRDIGLRHYTRSKKVVRNRPTYYHESFASSTGSYKNLGPANSCTLEHGPPQISSNWHFWPRNHKSGLFH